MLARTTCRRAAALTTNNAKALTRAANPTMTQRRTILGISKALDKRLYRMARGVMPTISQTEQVALGCGTIGFDRDIFTIQK